jgi:AsmA protein
LDISLASPTSPTLFPRPALVLQGITLSAHGASTPILLAARGQLALPWRTLFGGPTVISQLEIDSPRVDLEALQAWLAGMPAGAGAPSIPRIDTGVSISHGSLVRGDQLLLSDFSLQAGSLLSGQPFPLTVSARDAAGQPLQLRLTATPRIEGNVLQLDQITLHLTRGAELTLQLAGAARWHGAADASAQLRGKLDQAGAGAYDVAVTLSPANESEPLLLALQLEGPGNHADLRLPPLAWAHWWSGLNDPENPRLSLPAGRGQVELAHAHAAGVSIDGLTVQFGDAAPASASSAPASAATSAR